MADTSDEGQDGEIGVVDSARRELGWWGTLWAWLAGMFFLFVTITNFVQGMHHFPLLPVFDRTLIGFHQFTHWVLDTFLFSWVKAGIELGWLGLLVIVSHVFHGVVPYLPRIGIPGWYQDLSLVSMVLAAAVQRADDIDSATSVERHPKIYIDKRIAYSPINWPIMFLFAVYVSPIGSLIDSLSLWLGRLAFTVSRSKFLAAGVDRTVGTALNGISMRGILYFILMSVFVPQFGKFENAKPIIRYVRIMWLALLAATISSVIFFVANGYEVD